MYIYRAMSKCEFKNTGESPHFIKRYKWFSCNLGFILNRVLDGEFNNSKYINGRYTHLVCFEISNYDLKYFDKVGNRELQLDRRKTHMIKWRRVF